MDWTLFWQIAGPIVGLLGIGVMVMLFLWPRREKVKIKTGGLSHRVGKRAQNEVVIFKLYTTELQRTKGKEIRYLTQILIKLDKNLYDELKEYIDFCGRRQLILAEGSKPIPRYETVSIDSWNDYEYKIRDIQAWNSAKEQIADKISQATFDVGLVWQDKPNKIKRKTITPRDYGEWRKA